MSCTTDNWVRFHLTCGHEKNEMHHIHNCGLLYSGRKYHHIMEHHLRRIDRAAAFQDNFTAKPTYYRSIIFHEDIGTPSPENYKNVDG